MRAEAKSSQTILHFQRHSAKTTTAKISEARQFRPKDSPPLLQSWRSGAVNSEVSAKKITAEAISPRVAGLMPCRAALTSLFSLKAAMKTATPSPKVSEGVVTPSVPASAPQIPAR